MSSGVARLKPASSATQTSYIFLKFGYNTYGWMDELGFYVPSTVFQSFRDDGRVNVKGSVQ